METSILNQIATFRLARREITEEERRVGTMTPWGLCPTAPSSPISDQASLSFNFSGPSYQGFMEPGRHVVLPLDPSQRQTGPNQASPVEIPDPMTIDMAALDRE